MKLKITQNGVFNAKGQELEVGKRVTVKGDTVPGYLVGKVAVIEAESKPEPEPEEKELVVNPAEPEKS